MTSMVPGNEPAIFFHDLEQLAGRYPVRSLRVTAPDRSLLGLFLHHDSAESTEVEAGLTRLLSSLADQGRQELATSAAPELAALPDPGHVAKILRAELDRVRLTRLPCSLLLLETATAHAESTTPVLAKTAAAIKECLHHVDTLACHSGTVFAIVLPGTNLGKAVQRAKAIETAIGRETGVTATGTVRMGIALCYASDRLEAEQLLAQAEAELDRARRPGADRICHVSGIRAEDACQVSVEERAQLFGFLAKDTN